MSIYPEGHFAFVEQPDVLSKWSLEARIKAAVIEPLISLKPIPADMLNEARIKAAEMLNSRKTDKRHRRRVSQQSIYTWIDEFKQGGIDALERTPRKGESTLSPALYDYVRDLLITKDYPLTEVRHRAAEYGRNKLELPEDELPTPDKVRYVDRQLCNAVKLYGREGREAYRRMYEISGRFEATHRNEIWQSDHHLCDILVLNTETGKYERPWITLIIDDYSRCIMGFHISFEANSRTIALAFHHALLSKVEAEWVQHGLPKMVYADNGKDYVSDHIRQVCMHFSITLKHHEPHLPRSKGKVERFFRTLEEQCIRYLDGYLGNSPKNRPNEVKPTLTLEELRQHIITYIITRYHTQPHRSLQSTPLQRWAESEYLIRSVPSEEDLHHLLESEQRVVRAGKGIQFRNGSYTDDKGLLTEYDGHRVTIYFDRNDISKVQVWVRDKDRERFLCEALRDRGAQELAVIAKKKRAVIGEEVKVSNQRLRSRGYEQDLEQPPKSSKVSSPLPETPPGKRQFVRYRHELEGEGE
jgi:putative transposase